MKNDKKSAPELRQENGRLPVLIEAVTRPSSDRGEPKTPELARTEAALRASEERFAGIVGSAMDAIITIDADQRIVLFNRAAERMFLRPADEALGSSIEHFIPEKFRAAHRGYVQTFGASGTTSRNMGKLGILKGLRSDGEEFPIEASISQTNAAGEKLFTVIVRDITARIKAEEELRASEEFNRAVIESSPDCIKVLDADGRLVMMNQPGLCLMEIDDFSLFQGREWWEFWPEESHPRIRLALANARAGETGQFQAFSPTAKGTPKWWDVIVTPVRDGSGRFVSVSRDITANKRTEEALKEADRKKDEFLAILAHELRNPLAPIRTGLEILKRAGHDQVVHENIRQMMERALTQTVRLVDDLLDFSRVSSGKLQLRREQIELANVIQTVVELSRPLIEEKRHNLSVALPPEPVALDGDLARLAQVIANLLNNAAKYSPEGGQIRLSAARHGDEIQISVKDSGVGIAAADLARVFNMFAQVESSLEKSQGGLGIGLSLAKRLVEMHGGRIEAKSDGVGKGSEFIVYLPIISAEAPAHISLDGARQFKVTGKRILIADDNRAGADSLAMLLEFDGHQTAKAYDGLQALTIAESFRPEILLLDIGMPKLDGYGVAQRLRAEAWGGISSSSP